VPEEVLTAEQVAEEFKVNSRRVYKWIQDGELLATDLGTPSRHHYPSGYEQAVKEKQTEER
jgi:hypothetical protein